MDISLYSICNSIMSLLNLSLLNKYDQLGMHKIYDKWPNLARESYEANIDGVDFGKIDQIVFAGMGGSGAISDTLSSLLAKTKIHVCVVKGYLLPKTVDSNTLIVATSVSGNTLETLTVLDSAKKIGCKAIAFSAGGRIEDYCKKNKIEYKRFRQLHSPRASFPIFLYSALSTLDNIIPITKSEIMESLEILNNLQQKINSSNLNDGNPSLELASWIVGIPLIYYPFGLQPAAMRFKNSLHENAKIHVFVEELSEAFHNEILSWETPNSVKPILIEGADDHVQTREKWKILKEYFETKKIDYRKISSAKGSLLSKLINLIYLLDYTTIYLAVLSRIDPSPIRSIDFIKARL